MSRTIRKRVSSLPQGQRGYVSFCRGWISIEEDVNRDKSSSEKHKQSCFNSVHRTRRAVDREQINKIYRLDCYENAWFNDSKAEKKRKSVWWEVF